MKNIALIVLFLFGITFTSTVQASTGITTTTSQTSALDNSTNVVSTDSATDSQDADSMKKKKKRKKQFRDRSIAAKILIIAGLAVFAVLCLLYGTVTVG
jgi:hypothetical protein